MRQTEVANICSFAALLRIFATLQKPDLHVLTLPLRGSGDRLLDGKVLQQLPLSFVSKYLMRRTCPFTFDIIANIRSTLLRVQNHDLLFAAGFLVEQP